jgi:hypothetical protein
MQKTVFALLGLLLSIAGNLYAQENNQQQGKKRLSAEDRLFEAPSNSISFQYRIKLGKGNILRIDLANGYDIYNFRNIDSLLTVFLIDMEAFHDSLADPLTVKHIDYLIDTSSKKKVRIRQYRPAATSYLLAGAEPSILRIEQDTIRILIVTSAPGQHSGLTVNGLRYNRVSLFVNHYDELNSIARLNLNEVIAGIISKGNFNHNIFYHPEWKIIVQDSIVQTKLAGRRWGNQLAINAGAAVENYKNLFAPSAQVDAYVTLNRAHNQYRLGLSWEPLFFFAPDAQGRLQTYRNDMIVIHYEHNYLDRKPGFNLDPAFSLGYVFHREGDYFTQPSFRLTVGACKLKGSLVLEPALFFNNFFKGVTPGLRLSFGGF